MGLKTCLYLLLLALIGAMRLVELTVSLRHQRRLQACGVALLPEPVFIVMVLVHIGVLLGAALEVTLLRRPFFPWLAASAGVLFVLATGLRWWAIDTLSGHWNVRVMDSTSLGVVSNGPYRWLRHPNYLAVIVELEALPLIHTAWITALAGAVANGWVLRRRIALEESLLMQSGSYRAAMGTKPRLIPRLVRW